MTTPPEYSSKMADDSAQEDPSKWREPSQAQRLSNRVILRAQALANELKDDLNTLSLFNEHGGPIKAVAFVCPSSEQNHDAITSIETDDVRSPGYYLPRLLGTFKFESNILWAWIENAICDQEISFMRLFSIKASGNQSARWEAFRRAIKENERAVAHDLIIDQIAELPYCGILPELWEDFFGVHQKSSKSSPSQPLEAPRACWFEVDEPVNIRRNRNSQKVRLWPINQFKVDRKEALLDQVLPKLKIGCEDPGGLLASLYQNFIDPFIIGEHLPKFTSGISPYFDKPQFGRLEGIALPVYDAFSRDGLDPEGGFLSWLVFIPEKEKINDLRKEIFESKREQKSWLGLSFCVRKFATRLRQLQRREALEHRGRQAVGALELTKELSHYFTGWRRSDGSWHNPRFRDDEFFRHKKRNNTYYLAIDVSPTLGLGIDHRGAPLPVILESLPDTIVPEDPMARDEYLLSQTEAVRAFYRDASRLEAERRLGKLSGEVASAHDYSKDLNALDSQLARFSKELSQTREHFQHTRSDSVADLQSEIQERLGALKVPEEWWLLRARFMMAHQRTETEGRLYEQPEWCLDLIKRGTRGALIRLVKLLVWHPIDWEEHVKHASRTLSGPQMDEDQAELSPRHLSDWSRLFSYDERGRYAEIDKILGNYMRFMFVEERIEEEAFWTRHPPPKLNGDSLMTAQLLWAEMPDGGKTRWRPVGTLCPLLVFSLRAAYQHAWLDGFLRAAVNWEGGASMKGFLPKTPSVTLKSMDDGTGFYLTFPDPQTRIFESRRPGQMEGKIRLPWGTWERDLSRYEGLCHPWQRKLIREPASNDFQIQITTQ